MFRQSASLLAVLLSLFCAFASSTAMAQERQYEVYVCKAPACLGQPMPLTVTAVRHLQSAEWWRELEVEVKNTSDKPIYFIRFMIGLPDTDPDRKDKWMPFGLYGTDATYGNRELSNIVRRAEAGDVPLKPGDTFIFRIPESSQVGLSRQPVTLTKKVQFRIETINFGDGTGIVAGGSPTSRPQR